MRATDELGSRTRFPRGPQKFRVAYILPRSDELQMPRAAFFPYITLCVGLLTGCWEGISRQVLATVLSVRGEVVYASQERNDFRTIDPDTTLGVGSLVRTADRAGLDIALLPGVLLQVSGNSEFKIEELTLVKDGDETQGGMLNRMARIQFNKGKINVYFEQPDGATGRLTIITDRVTLNAKPGCLFQIQTDKSRTRLTCVLGEVYASQGNRAASVINQGFFQEWPSERPTPASAANDARGQIETTDALKAERELRELPLPPRNRRPF